ncbi:hypothetical protein CEXT_378401 [Caerostris extrusa]|uniref:Uncharacterized protein n=1 Tax=Caerostris extrusa TaxID=172846 RepID=A0AAV4WWI2_CAEEX|nr:hypothetical protein CEXT_378401 [Caerostris extrusa]
MQRLLNSDPMCLLPFGNRLEKGGACENLNKHKPCKRIKIGIGDPIAPESQCRADDGWLAEFNSELRMVREEEDNGKRNVRNDCHYLKFYIKNGF